MVAFRSLEWEGGRMRVIKGFFWVGVFLLIVCGGLFISSIFGDWDTVLYYSYRGFIVGLALIGGAAMAVPDNRPLAW